MGYLELAKRVETEGRATTAIQPVPHETLEGIFQETLDDLNRRCVQGLLGEANSSLLAQEQEAKAHLDKTWEACLQSKSSLENFRQAVAQWHGAVATLFTTPPQGQKVQGRLL